MTSFIFSKKQLATFLVSVVLSIFLVALTAFGITYVDTDSVGIATSSPGGALGVKGVAFIDGFALADYLVATSSGSIFQWENGSATSTTYAIGVGGFGSVKGNWNVEATSTVSSLIATSTLSVGTTSPATLASVLSVQGNAYITQGLGVGVATTSAGGLFVKGSAEIYDGLIVRGGISNALYVQDATVGIGTSTLGNTFEVAGFGVVKGNWNIGATSTVSSLIATNTLSVGSSSPTFQFASVGRANFGSGDVSISGGLLDVQSTATSTFDGGIAVPSGGTGGLSTAVGLTVSGGDIQSSGKLTVTSTATSSITGSLTVDTESLNVDSGGNGVGIATSTYPGITGDVSANLAIGGGAASSTLYIAGGPTVGASIILRSSNGADCILIVANAADADVDGNIALVGKTTECPLP